MTELDLQKIQRMLREEKAQVLQRVLEDDNGRNDDMNPDRDDLAQDYIEMEQDVALQAIDREQLERIDNALARIHEGTYGICMACGEPIPAERLEILPYATLCVRCQAKQERRW